MLCVRWNVFVPIRYTKAIEGDHDDDTVTDDASGGAYHRYLWFDATLKRLKMLFLFVNLELAAWLLASWRSRDEVHNDI